MKDLIRGLPVWAKWVIYAVYYVVIATAAYLMGRYSSNFMIDLLFDED